MLIKKKPTQHVSRKSLQFFHQQEYSFQFGNQSLEYGSHATKQRSEKKIKTCLKNQVLSKNFQQQHKAESELT